PSAETMDAVGINCLACHRGVLEDLPAQPGTGHRFDMPRRLFSESPRHHCAVNRTVKIFVERLIAEEQHIFRRELLGGQRSTVKAVHREARSEEHTSELQSLRHLVCRLLLEKKKKKKKKTNKQQSNLEHIQHA